MRLFPWQKAKDEDFGPGPDLNVASEPTAPRPPSTYDERIRAARALSEASRNLMGEPIERAFLTMGGFMLGGLAGTFGFLVYVSADGFTAYAALTVGGLAFAVGAFFWVSALVRLSAMTSALKRQRVAFQARFGTAA